MQEEIEVLALNCAVGTIATILLRMIFFIKRTYIHSKKELRISGYSNHMY